MNFKFLGIVTFSVCLATVVYGFNAHRLAFETETYVGRISSNIPFSEDIVREEDMIRGSLSFLADDEIFEDKYIQSGAFQTLYEQSIHEITKPSFVNFSKACLNLYRNFERALNQRKQVSVHMLLERVKEKFAEQLKRDERLEQLKRQYESNSGFSRDSRAEADRMLDFFVNIDRKRSASAAAQ